VRSGEPPDEKLLARRPLYYIAFVLMIFSAILRQPLLFVAGLLVFALAFVPELWYRYCLRQLTVDRRPATTRMMLGDTIEMTIAIENRKPLPLPWLQIVDDVPESLPIRNQQIAPSSSPERALLTNTLALWAYQRVRRRYFIRALARGAYRFGPMKLRSTDPFGILTRETTLDQTVALVIHPLVAPLERFGLPAHAPFGERKAPRRLLEDPLRVSGIRDYVPGDEPRRIHWKATARTGSLQSKVYESSTSHTLAIFLDVRTLSHSTMGYDPALIELHICAAASVANWAIEQGYAVGIYANGTLGVPEFAEIGMATRARHAAPLQDETAEERLQREIERTTATLRLRIAPSTRQEQLTHIFDGLARTLPYYGLPMEQLIVSEERALPTGATIVYIGTESILDVPLIVALRRLKSHGHAVSLLLTQSHESAQQGADHTIQLAGLDTHYIGGKATWENLITDALGAEAQDFFRNQRRGFTGYVGSPLSDDGLTDEVSSLAGQSDQPDTNAEQENGTSDGHTTQPGSKAGGWRRSRALVVE